MELTDYPQDCSMFSMLKEECTTDLISLPANFSVDSELPNYMIEMEFKTVTLPTNEQCIVGPENHMVIDYMDAVCCTHMKLSEPSPSGFL